MNILPFIQNLANELCCSYSLGEFLSLHNRNNYFIPDGIIYFEERPFVIIEEKNTKNSRRYKKVDHEIARIQDYLGIKWSILLDDDNFYLRPLLGDFKKHRNVFEIAQIISSENTFHLNPLEKDKYFEVLKQRISEYLNNLPQNKRITVFVDGLDVNDIEIVNDEICFTTIKETEFFMSLLKPVEKKELWRYTTKNSLFLMLRDHNQNMLSLNCMNDISEIDYSDKYIDPETCVLRKSIDEANRVFILSCCDETKSDDLMMWRLYAQDAEGVSLCYHLYSNKIDNDYFYLAHVCYGQKDSHPELDLIKNIMDCPVHGLHFRFRKWIVWKHFFKPYGFNYEDEIRLIYFEHKDSLAKKTIWIEDSKSGIVSPMKLFCLEETYKPKYPLSLIKVLFGPKSREAPINLVQFSKMYNEAKIFCPGIFPEFKMSQIDIYR